MNTIQKLTEFFRQFPGIGPRQARRFVYFLLTRSPAEIKEFTALVEKLQREVATCESCFRFFTRNGGNSPLCSVCSDPNRDAAELMIVSRDVDVENVEKSGSYRGKYFVLGGTVPILEKEPGRKIRQKELTSLLEKPGSGIKEIILAMNLNAEGENTEDYLRILLKPYAEKYSVKISTLGRGLSTGTELEYSDSETIKNALKNRQ